PGELKSRLRGDAVHVELDNGRVDDARRVLEEARAPVESTLADGRTLVSRVPEGGHALPGILAAMAAAGIPVASVSVHRPSLDGSGTSSYITSLAPAIVVMNAFFSASWSGMSMVFDIERKFVERFLATPASRLSLVLSQIVRSALTAAIQGVIILLVALALG